MKKYIALTVLLLTLTLAGCAAAKAPESSAVPKSSAQSTRPAEPEKEKLKIGVRNDAPGFAYWNIDTGKIDGFEIDLINKITADLGMEPKFVVIDDESRGDALKSDRVDAVIATFTVTADREDDFLFSRPYYTGRTAFLVPEDSSVEKVMDLDGAKIGVTADTTSADDLSEVASKKGIDVTPVSYSSFDRAKKALFDGKISALYMDEAILRSYQGGRILDEYFTLQPYAIAASKDNAELIESINTLLEQYEEDGTAAAFMDHWELHDAA